jgi:hypothetical protein
LNPNYFFGNISLWIRSWATIWVIFKLIMKSNCWLLQLRKLGDNTDILKLQESFLWLLFFNNLRKRTSHIFFRTFKWRYGEALSSTFNYYRVSQSRLCQRSRIRLFIQRTRRQASLVWIAAILRELRLLCTLSRHATPLRLHGKTCKPN